jgi:hypothetical protein
MRAWWRSSCESLAKRLLRFRAWRQGRSISGGATSAIGANRGAECSEACCSRQPRDSNQRASFSIDAAYRRDSIASFATL